MDGTAPPESELLRSLLDASVDGLLAFDRECRYTAWNSAMERISGLRREEVLGRRAFDLFPFLKETGEDRYFYEALAGRGAVAAARRYTVPETGHGGFFDGYYAPLRDARGEVVGGVAVIRDTTESRAASEALRASEERYRAFIANSSEGIWRFELEEPVPVALPEDEQVELFYRHGYLAECNDVMARMYGYERAAEVVGARLGDFLVRDDPKNEEYLRAFVRSGYRLTDAESIEVDREGRRRYFSNNLVGVVAGGRALRAWGTQRDVTERKLVEEELRATEHRFSMFMEHLPGLSWIKDLGGRYVYANEAAARAFRTPRAELLGKTDEEVFPAETAALFRENDRLAVERGEGVLTVETLKHDDGPHHSIVSKFPIPGRAGEALLVGGIAIDVTERLRAEREREELLAREQAARREAEEASRLKDEFLAAVSHELRTPLTAILGWAHLLRREGADDAMRGHALEVVERNARAQAQLIDDLLEVSRIVTGKLRIDVRPVELLQVVEAAREAVEPAAEAKGVLLEAHSEVETAAVRGDADRLQQVVWNLLSNAVKFTPAGGRVALRVARAGPSVEISVADTGEGIAAEFLPHVFDRFRQADMGTTRQHGGLGLGLSIVRHLVELHGGSVRAESEGRGRGSTFTVGLPLLREAGPGPRDEAAGVERPAEGRPPAALLSGVRLLVVEDEPDTLELLRIALGSYGAEVTTAGSAAEALAALRGARPDVLLSDVGMAGVDGYGLLRRVRALGPGAGGDVTAVALTAYARDEDRERALAAGFQEHIAKPVDPAALAELIARLISRRG